MHIQMKHEVLNQIGRNIVHRKCVNSRATIQTQTHTLSLSVCRSAIFVVSCKLNQYIQRERFQLCVEKEPRHRKCSIWFQAKFCWSCVFPWSCFCSYNYSLCAERFVKQYELWCCYCCRLVFLFTRAIWSLSTKYWKLCEHRRCRRSNAVTSTLKCKHTNL